jgi:hypothetical protein
VPGDAEDAKILKTRTLTRLYKERSARLDIAHAEVNRAVAAVDGG